MRRKVCAGLLVVAVVCVAAPLAFGETDAQSKASNNMFVALAMGFGMAIAVFAGAIGQSRAIAASVEAMARQPEAGGRIQGAMIIGLALIETLVIYMLLICFTALNRFVEL